MLNAFQIMIMQSHEDADRIIQKLKIYIDNSNCSLKEIEFDIPDHILDYDKKRIEQEVKEYYYKIRRK